MQLNGACHVKPGNCALWEATISMARVHNVPLEVYYSNLYLYLVYFQFVINLEIFMVYIIAGILNNIVMLLLYLFWYVYRLPARCILQLLILKVSHHILMVLVGLN